MLISATRPSAIVTRGAPHSRLAARVAAAIVLLATVAADVAAQRARGLPDPPRVAGIAPPPPAPPAPPTAGQFPGISHSQAPVNVVHAVAAGVVPVFVLSDGRVFADFGLGYEPVLRSCVAHGAVTPPTVPPRYETPVYTAPTYPTPTPTAATSKVATPKGASMPTAPRSQAATAACWTHNAGRVVVIR
jgi:hypothetical protein